MTERRLGRYGDLEVWYDLDLGYAHLHPLPDSAKTKAYYNDDQFYQQHSPPDWFDKEKRENEAGLWDSYYQYLYNLIKGKTAKVVINRKQQEIGLHKATPKILDWGCGAGWWLKWLYANTSRNHQGIEPSTTAWRYAGQPTYIHPSPDNLQGMFDVISLQLVLEHVIDPIGFLVDISKYLAPGGKLLVTVPNDFNPLQKRLDYYGFISPVHINYFVPQGLRNVLNKAGYRMLYEGATFPMETFPLLGLNYINNDKLGRKCHAMRLKLEKLCGWRIFKLYRWLYKRWGIGRELVFVAEKTE